MLISLSLSLLKLFVLKCKYSNNQQCQKSVYVLLLGLVIFLASILFITLGGRGGGKDILYMGST